jgi:hypothetical protein
MGKSYRIKATPGKDQNIIVQVDQDFEQLEILSLKVRQDDVYLKMCSDYGVIAGRVFANNGYGLPNAKISVFIPVTNEDLKNPVISSIYPYKSLSQQNEDGYKYNLLPYLPSYSQHVPTGTFPSRKDVLIDQTAIELYDKYYKYTVQTNESGDYLIYGVPVGTQTLVMNVDLSDIGPFSLGPQDLVRMGLATEDQVDGNKFTSSTNLYELPQIVVLNKTIEVAPFWGEQDICQIGITRTDFDLTSEANITIKPTAIFLGSLISTSNTAALKQNCKARKETGDLCQMITGPGEMIAITQTIFHDNNGLPVLERAKLPNGGKLIDGDGTWMYDLDMNYDYVTTNEFGEQVISVDPKVGIPTKAKYRFKIKWQQSKSISEDYKRAYFLVPNVKEKGWNYGNGIDPLDGSAGPSNYADAINSYAFDLDWSGYTSGPLNLTNPELLSYINCEDRFYQFDYNKVYTVSGLIDNFKKQNAKERFLAIKRIDDDTCDDSVNKFPANDGVFHTSLLWIILNILISLLGFLMLPFLIMYDCLAFIVNLIYLIVASVLCWLCSICFGWPFDWCPFDFICSGTGLDCGNLHNPLQSLKLPMITYPDCEACDCNELPEGASLSSSTPNNSTTDFAGSKFIIPFNRLATYSTLEDPYSFNNFVGGTSLVSYSDRDIVKQLVGGLFNNNVSNHQYAGASGLIGDYYTYDLPFGERINIFNTKSSYYTGANQTKVTYEPSINSGKYHYDNTVTIICDSGVKSLSAGTMFTFVNPLVSTDVNITGATINDIGTHNLTGITHIPSTVSITYADPSNPNNPNITPPPYMTTNLYNANLTKTLYYSYPSDVEYFEVITAMTISDFRNLVPSSPYLNSFGDIVESNTTIVKWNMLIPQSFSVKPIEAISQNSRIIICQRGVDPYSPKVTMNFGVGRIFGETNHDAIIVGGDYRLNVPIRNTDPSIGGGPGKEIVFDHNPGGVINNNTPNNGFNLFNPSYVFTPSSVDFSGYNTHLHTYYSSLDYKTVSSGTIMVNSSDSSSFLNSSKIESNITPLGYKFIRAVNSNDYYANSPYNARKYTSLETVAGGSYVYTNTIGTQPYSYYYSQTYPSTLTLTMNDSANIVMRSDRLPSSDTTDTNFNNSYVLQQNQKLNAYIFSDTEITNYSNTLSSPPIGESEAPDSNAYENSVLTTFTCGTMVDLPCYDSNGLNMTVNQACKASDRVNDYGCYVFCPRCDTWGDVFGPLAGLGEDLNVFSRYIFRFKFFFALCQGVLGQVFNNNWVSGVLFAYPFKINTYYDGKNKVSERQFCSHTVMLHPTTNTFYYRSSPWNENISQFVGQNSPGDTSRGSNVTNLKYPTTILNMGPRESFLKEIVLNGNFDGYNMNQFGETTYKDTDELVNLFAITRVLDSNFLSNFFGNQITRLFTRPGRKVDADFAQSIAVNSQLGITPLDTTHYTTDPATPGGASVITPGTSSNNIMMGIYYSASTQEIQVRDYVSPLRTIRWSILSPTNFAYDYIQNKSQLVPHYKWNITAGPTIFGNQDNNWATSPNPSSITAIKFQEMDRLSSEYPIYNSGINQYNAKGYIYANDNNSFSATTYHTSAVSLTNNPSLGGAPWYFYFGLRKGNTAINRFYHKFIGETNLNE